MRTLRCLLPLVLVLTGACATQNFGYALRDVDVPPRLISCPATPTPLPASAGTLLHISAVEFALSAEGAPIGRARPVAAMAVVHISPPAADPYSGWRAFELGAPKLQPHVIPNVHACRFEPATKDGRPVAVRRVVLGLQ